MCVCAMNYGNSLQILVDTLMDLDSNQKHIFIYLLSLLFLSFSFFFLYVNLYCISFVFLSFIKMVYIPPLPIFWSPQIKKTSLHVIQLLQLIKFADDIKRQE